MSPASTGPTAIDASRMIRTEEMTKANVRPRSRSSTSWPISV